jgi:hypothetical protein
VWFAWFFRWQLRKRDRLPHRGGYDVAFYDARVASFEQVVDSGRRTVGPRRPSPPNLGTGLPVLQLCHQRSARATSTSEHEWRQLVRKSFDQTSSAGCPQDVCACPTRPLPQDVRWHLCCICLPRCCAGYSTVEWVGFQEKGRELTAVVLPNSLADVGPFLDILHNDAQPTGQQLNLHKAMHAPLATRWRLSPSLRNYIAGTPLRRAACSSPLMHSSASSSSYPLSYSYSGLELSSCPMCWHHRCQLATAQVMWRSVVVLPMAVAQTATHRGPWCCLSPDSRVAGLDRASTGVAPLGSPPLPSPPLPSPEK